MTNEELFLKTLKDIKVRARPNGQDEYDVLMLTPLLRKLLIDARPLVEVINQKYRLKVKYTITNYSFPPYPGDPEPAFWAIQDGFDPGTSLRPRGLIEVNKEQLLQRLLIVENGQKLTVLDVIKYLAHVEGAVHIGTPSNDKEKALAELTKKATIGGYPPATRSIQAVARVVTEGLESLRKAVQRDARVSHPKKQMQAKQEGRLPRGQRASTQISDKEGDNPL
ncbi:MAG: hypothetical protein DLM69_09560 [Candidatus Chloroheliales bacterium]|nr:MAG: hypothetical protein DLM69_09560 [Chloroflexota bacterium]